MTSIVQALRSAIIRLLGGASVSRRLILSFMTINLLMIGMGAYVVMLLEDGRKDVHALVKNVDSTADTVITSLNDIKALAHSVTQVGELATQAYINLRKLQSQISRLDSGSSENLTEVVSSLQDLQAKTAEQVQQIRTVVDDGKRIADESGGNFTFIESSIRSFSRVSVLL